MSDRKPRFTDVDLERSIPAGTLGRQVRTAVGWTLVGNWGAFAAQLVTTMVLARLLSPEDYGLVGMVLTITVFVDQFRTMGLSQAVVQRENLTVAQVNALFYVNAAVGFGLAGIVALGAPLVASFYGRSELVAITVALAATYALGGLGVQANALLTRQLNFRALAIRYTVARLLASAAAIAAALGGLGYWSLVVQQVSMSLFSLLLVWVAVKWRPGRPGGFRSALPLVKFGAGITGAGIFNTLGRAGDALLIGRVLGAADLGLYTRAAHLESMPLQQLRQPLNGAVTPLLSSLQREPDRYRALYTKAIGGLAVVGLPGTAVLAVGAEDVIAVFLGDQWLAATPIMRWMAVGGAVALITSSVAWLYQSSGRGNAFATWSGAASVVILASYAVGLAWGVVGVAAAGALVQIALAPLAFLFAIRGTPITMHDVGASIARPLLVAVAVLATSLGAWWLVPGSIGHLATLVMLGAVAGGTWLAVVGAWPSARRQAMDLVNVARQRGSRRPAPPPDQPEPPHPADTSMPVPAAEREDYR